MAFALPSPLHPWTPLCDGFAAIVPPTPVPTPYWVAQHHDLAHAWGLNPDWFCSATALAQLAGNHVPSEPSTYATVYSGHQFGQWAGRLGDGRALFIGKLDTPTGWQEVQLKGAGRTPFSRMGDGRAVLRSSIREFLASEALHGLGIPTTRALAIVGSPLPVRREGTETAAIVTRVAPSFLRFGHFEHFCYSGQHERLRQLADHVIDQFYPECRNAPSGPATYAALLQAVSERTARLMAQWQAVGFCHGVMNTDNMSVLGLTLDYGPFQFMDGFDPDHICNHSDSTGRYAYKRQPAIGHWNLFCLGQALLPLMNDDTELALAALNGYHEVFSQALHAQMCRKLGLLADSPAASKAEPLYQSLLYLMAQHRIDYTLFWRRLSHWVNAPTPLHHASLLALWSDEAHTDLATWLLQYKELFALHQQAPSADLMLKTNPKYVLRNHLAQQAIEQSERGDHRMVQDLLAVLSQPFDEHPAFESWAELPPDWAASICISCSS